MISGVFIREAHTHRPGRIHPIEWFYKAFQCTILSQFINLIIEAISKKNYDTCLIHISVDYFICSGVININLTLGESPWKMQDNSVTKNLPEFLGDGFYQPGGKAGKPSQFKGKSGLQKRNHFLLKRKPRED